MTDLSIVEQRFQELLKQRLSVEIEKNPPLFPWEKEIIDYPVDTVEEPVSWLPQVEQLPIASSFPEKILTQLLEACSEIVTSFTPQPAQMVQAVSQLFPDERSFLNEQTRLLTLAVGYRDISTLEQEEESASEELISYDEGNDEEKMTLSLLMVQEILKALTFEVSAKNRSLLKQWATNHGNLKLRVDYLLEQEQIRVEVKLPKAGQISWLIQDKTLKVQGNPEESVVFYLTEVQVNSTYAVTIDLLEPQANPLTFSIRVQP